MHADIKNKAAYQPPYHAADPAAGLMKYGLVDGQGVSMRGGRLSFWTET